MYRFKAISTKYKERIYRSKLEARWAAMFDLLGWNFEYEPFDLNGWIPDFVIYGINNILVEVKPFELVDNFLINKISFAGNNSNIIVLFETWINNLIGYEVRRKEFPDLDNGKWPLLLKDYPDDTHDIASMGQFDGMLYDKSNYRKFFMEKDKFTELWNICGNQTMFIKPSVA